MDSNVTPPRLSKREIKEALVRLDTNLVETSEQELALAVKVDELARQLRLARNELADKQQEKERLHIQRKDLLRQLKKLSQEIDLDDPEMQNALQILAEIEETLPHKLKQYQKEALVKFFHSFIHPSNEVLPGLFLGDDMGLGKTATTVAFIKVAMKLERQAK